MLQRSGPRFRGYFIIITIYNIDYSVAFLLLIPVVLIGDLMVRPLALDSANALSPIRPPPRGGTLRQIGSEDLGRNIHRWKAQSRGLPLVPTLVGQSSDRFLRKYFPGCRSCSAVWMLISALDRDASPATRMTAPEGLMHTDGKLFVSPV